VFVASVVSVVIVTIACVAFDAGRLLGWLLGRPSRLMLVTWMVAAAVVAKYWLAAYTWRNVAPRYQR
jgi:hypothetical protein